MSIAAQTSRDFELIVIDNGSHDNSAQEIEATLHECGLQARVILNQVNRGIAAALNQALELAEGRYFIAFAADDLMFPHRLEHQVSVFDTCEENVAVLGSLCEARFEDSGETIPMGPWGAVSPRQIRIRLLSGRPIPAPAALYRTSALRSLGGYDARCPIEDMDMLVRLVFEAGHTIRLDDCIVATYRRHSANVTNDQRVLAAGIAFVMTRATELDLTMREMRVARRLVKLRTAPHWFRVVRALEAGDKDELRRSGLRAAVQPGLLVGQRIRCVFAAAFPRRALARRQSSIRSTQ